VLVVIVNYRTADLAIDCLRSLEGEVRAVGGARAVVVDNASGDGSAETIGAAIDGRGWSGWATLLPLATNDGFGAGNNAAIGPALASRDPPPPDFVLILNPDTVVLPGALTALVGFLQAHPEVGIAGSRLEDPDGTPQHSRFRFHSVWSELDSGLKLGLVTRLLRKRTVAAGIVDHDSPSDWVAGASMMVRREVFADVGLFDTGYFLYYEEADFCLNARRAGWACWTVHASRVMHYSGRSTGLTGTTGPRARRPRYWFASRHRYFRKNHGRLYALCAGAAWCSGYVLWRIRRVLQGKPDNDPPYMLWDFLRFTLGPDRGRPT
jgi:GT2 family glycosyltransferase